MLLLTQIIALICATNSNLIRIKQKTIKKQTLIIQIIYLPINPLIIVALTKRFKSKRATSASVKSAR